MKNSKQKKPAVQTMPCNLSVPDVNRRNINVTSFQDTYLDCNTIPSQKAISFYS